MVRGARAKCARVSPRPIIRFDHVIALQDILGCFFGLEHNVSKLLLDTALAGSLSMAGNRPREAAEERERTFSSEKDHRLWASM